MRKRKVAEFHREDIWEAMKGSREEYALNNTLFSILFFLVFFLFLMKCVS